MTLLSDVGVDEPAAAIRELCAARLVALIDTSARPKQPGQGNKSPTENGKGAAEGNKHERRGENALLDAVTAFVQELEGSEVRKIL